MRKILFRGKRADNGEWTEGFYVRLFEKKNGFYQTNHYIFDGNIRLGEERYAGHGNYCQDVIICKKKIDEKTLGQFTGMTDKNGKNIFEGDIIRDNTGECYIVEFRDGCFMFSCNDGGEIYYDIMLRISKNKQTTYKYGEVIGNIHDNSNKLYL